MFARWSSWLVGLSYQWLASYADIAEHLHDAIPKDARVLVVGCGNSDLSADMYDDGYRQEGKAGLLVLLC